MCLCFCSLFCSFLLQVSRRIGNVRGRVWEAKPNTEDELLQTIKCMFHQSSFLNRKTVRHIRAIAEQVKDVTQQYLLLKAQKKGPAQHETLKATQEVGSEENMKAPGFAKENQGRPKEEGASGVSNHSGPVDDEETKRKKKDPHAHEVLNMGALSVSSGVFCFPPSSSVILGPVHQKQDEEGKQSSLIVEGITDKKTASHEKEEEKEEEEKKEKMKTAERSWSQGADAPESLEDGRCGAAEAAGEESGRETERKEGGLEEPKEREGKKCEGEAMIGERTDEHSADERSRDEGGVRS